MHKFADAFLDKLTHLNRNMEEGKSEQTCLWKMAMLQLPLSICLMFHNAPLHMIFCLLYSLRFMGFSLLQIFLFLFNLSLCSLPFLVSIHLPIGPRGDLFPCFYLGSLYHSQDYCACLLFLLFPHILSGCMRARAHTHAHTVSLYLFQVSTYHLSDNSCLMYSPLVYH